MVWQEPQPYLEMAARPRRGLPGNPWFARRPANHPGGIVDLLAKRTGEFKENFDSAVSHTMLDGTRLEANAKHRADDLHAGAKRLAEVFHDKRDKNNPAVREQADRTIAAASELNQVMLHHRFTENCSAIGICSVPI